MTSGWCQRTLAFPGAGVNIAYEHDCTARALAHVLHQQHKAQFKAFKFFPQTCFFLTSSHFLALSSTPLKFLIQDTINTQRLALFKMCNLTNKRRPNV